MAQIENFTWPQGEDLVVELIYKEGASAESATAVDLSANYAVRMDLLTASTNERVYTFNSAEIADVDPIEVGAQVDSTLESALSSGAGGTPNISITVPRSLTLPGGDIYALMAGSPSVLTYNYDLFLRNTSTNRQARILQGVITIEKSHTLWL